MEVPTENGNTEMNDHQPAECCYHCQFNMVFLAAFLRRMTTLIVSHLPQNKTALLTVGYFGNVVCKLQVRGGKDLLLFPSPDHFKSNVLKNIKCRTRVFSGVSLYGECFRNSSGPLTGCYGMSMGCVIVWL